MTPAAHTTAPEQSACPAVNACCKCGPTLTCKTARCECRKAAGACMSWRCLGQCSNVVPQTQRDEQRAKVGEIKGEMGTGKRKRRRRQVRGEKPQTQTERESKENVKGSNTQTSLRRTATRGVAQRGEGSPTPAPTEEEGEEGD